MTTAETKQHRRNDGDTKSRSGTVPFERDGGDCPAGDWNANSKCHEEHGKPHSTFVFRDAGPVDEGEGKTRTMEP